MAHETATQAAEAKQRTSMDKDGGIEVIEAAQTSNEQLWIQEYDLIRDKSKEELDALNKKVLKMVSNLLKIIKILLKMIKMHLSLVPIGIILALEILLILMGSSHYLVFSPYPSL